MLIPYYAEISIQSETPGKRVALVHPGGAHTAPLYFRGLDLLSAVYTKVEIKISRHSTKATGGTSTAAKSFLDGAPASIAQALSDDVAWPVDTTSFDVTAFPETRGLGGSIVLPPNNNAITLLPDHSLVFETVHPDREGTYHLRLFWGEPAPLIPHLLTVLPADGAYTAGTYFEIPFGLSQISFAGTYTAATPSTGARPKFRVSWGRGASTGFIQPIRETTLDLSLLPVASRSMYLDELRYATTVAHGTSVQFVVAYDVVPGMNRVRLDAAEDGAQATPGTVSIGVTGS